MPRVISVAMSEKDGMHEESASSVVGIRARIGDEPPLVGWHFPRIGGGGPAS
ncbi:hypothetical protein KDA_46810 [Dictyobacter alpinus]|uniref:Uncharacterized protein n=1 Tax=Dictyobacter alpinus TaxID=2014873 RepID=A0A402BD37_9CHLR|nr:hypothetical protein KDA_46810 [Dictyobacter alpinus]